MRRGLIALIIAGAWLAVLPPLFTHGACTAEFDAVGAEFGRLRSELGTVDHAKGYLTSHAISYALVSAERCDASPPRGVESCPGGPILLAVVPVKNQICRIYRDDRTGVQLGFNNSQQLVRIQTDMNPFRKLKSELFGFELDWGR